MEHAAGGEERGLDPEPERGGLRHVEVTVAPGDLDKRRLHEIIDLGPDRDVDVAPADHDGRVPAVVEDPDRDRRLGATGRRELGDRSQTAAGQRDRGQEPGDANR